MKEKLVTAILGITIGILVIAGIFAAPKILNKSKVAINFANPVADGGPDLSTLESGPVTIESLSNGQIVTDKTVAVTGKTGAGIHVVVTSSADEMTVTADTDGNFTANVGIDEGENTIVAAVVDERGTLQIAKKQIVREISE